MIRTIFRAFAVLTIFVLGMAIGNYAATSQAETWQDGDYEDGVLLANAMAVFPQPVVARENPTDRVPEKAIKVYGDRIVLDIQDAEWATFTDTKSMEPIIFAGSNAIEVQPKTTDDIKVGDIVSYRSKYADGSTIHRVVYKGEDEDGTYFIMKGDNLPTSDPGRVRFDQIDRVVVAIIY
jgi:hypothetical protein